MKYSDYYLAKNTKNNKISNKNFMKWMDKIESNILKKYGLDLLDLPDESYMIMFDDSYSTLQVIQIVIKNNMLC